MSLADRSICALACYYGVQMYWLRIKPLKQDLINRQLTERERFKYLLAWELASVIIAVMWAFSPSPMGGMEGGIAIAAVGLGVWYAYYRNGGSRGSGLLERYLSLGWVLSIRIVIARTIVSYILMRVLAPFGIDHYEDEALPGIEALLSLVFGGYFIWAIGRHIRDIHEAVDAGLFSIPAAVAPPPVGQPPLPPAGLDSQTAQGLQRFVETVVQREMASAPRDIDAGSAVVHKPRGRKSSPRKPASARRRPARRAKSSGS